MAIYGIRIAGTGVRFSLGPPIKNMNQKNIANKKYYLVGLFSMLLIAAKILFSDSDNRLVYPIALFVIVMLYTYIWKKSGYGFGSERYENTAGAKVVKFFGAIFVIITSVFLLVLIALLFGWIKI